MATNRWARLLMAGALAMTLAGCTDSGSGAEKAPAGQGPAPSAEAGDR